METISTSRMFINFVTCEIDWSSCFVDFPGDWNQNHVIHAQSPPKKTVTSNAIDNDESLIYLPRSFNKEAFIIEIESQQFADEGKKKAFATLLFVWLFFVCVSNVSPRVKLLRSLIFKASWETRNKCTFSNRFTFIYASSKEKLLKVIFCFHHKNTKSTLSSSPSMMSPFII